MIRVSARRLYVLVLAALCVGTDVPAQDGARMPVPFAVP